MTRYDAGALYDDGHKYDETDAPIGAGALLWILQIDWSNSGSWPGTNEAGRVVACSITRGTRYYMAADGFEPPDVGRLVLELDDHDRRYDPRNTGSALYPNVKPGRFVRLSVRRQSDGLTYPVFTGRIEGVTPISGTDRRVRLEIVDGLKWLERNAVTTGARINIGLSAAITWTIAQSAYPVRYGWSVQPDTQPVRVFDADDADAKSVIDDLARSGLGLFFVDRKGRATFYNRGYSGQTTHNLTQAEALKEIELSTPWENIRNDVRVIANRWIKQPVGTIWSLGQAVKVPTGGTTVTAVYQPATDLILSSPKAVTALTSGAADVTSYVSISPAFGSKKATLTITNTYGADVYLVSLDIRGRAYEQTQTEYRHQDATSQAAYDRASLKIDYPYLQDSNFAHTFSAELLEWLKAPNDRVTVQIEQRFNEQYAVELYDKVHFVSAALGIDDVFHVTGIEHSWLSETGQSVLTRMYLHKVFNSTTSITPAEDVADGGEIPEPGQPIDIPTPPTPPTGGDTPLPKEVTCIDQNAPANGPWILNYRGTIGDNQDAVFIEYPCILRAGTAANPSKVVIVGTWFKYAGAWSATTDNNMYTVYGLDWSGNKVATGTNGSILGGGRVREVTFNLTAATAVRGFLIEFNNRQTLPTASLKAFRVNSSFGNTEIVPTYASQDGKTAVIEVQNIDSEGGSWSGVRVRYERGGTRSCYVTYTGDVTSGSVGYRRIEGAPGNTLYEDSTSITSGWAIENRLFSSVPDNSGAYWDILATAGAFNTGTFRIKRLRVTIFPEAVYKAEIETVMAYNICGIR